MFELIFCHSCQVFREIGLNVDEECKCTLSLSMNSPIRINKMLSCAGGSSSLIAKRYFAGERSKECNYLYCFFRNRFTSPRNGDSPSLSVESKQSKRMLSWNLMAQTSSTAPDHGPLAVWRTIFSQQ